MMEDRYFVDWENGPGESLVPVIREARFALQGDEELLSFSEAKKKAIAFHEETIQGARSSIRTLKSLRPSDLTAS